MHSIHFVGVPEEYKEEIENLVSTALDNIIQGTKFEGPLSVVVFEATQYQVIPELGIMGRAIGREAITVLIDFSRTDVWQVILEQVQSMVYHEAAHLIWEKQGGSNETLLGVVVNEGIASFTEKYFHEDAHVPYIAEIKGEEIFFNNLKEQRDDTNYSYGEWMYGEGGKYPRWLGYRLGYLIVKRCFDERKLTLEQLYKMPSQEIADCSGLL
jgi:hypothetical protein